MSGKQAPANGKPGGLSLTTKNLSFHGTHATLDAPNPKNKNVNSFISDIQKKSPQHHHLLNKLYAQAQKDGFQTFADLPPTYSFGERKRTGSMLAAARDHDIVAIMANQYAENPHKVSIEHARKMLSEKKTIYKDHLGRPTQAQVLRDRHINNHLQSVAMSNTMTPYKVRNTIGGGGTAVQQLHRSGSSLSIRDNSGYSPATPMVRKKNTRNLMILGNSQSANKAMKANGGLNNSQFFSLQQTQAV